MSNITLDSISAPGLGSASYGTNINTQFTNIDSNFKKIVEGEYLKGQSGDIVMLEEIDLLNSTLSIKDSFLGYISNLGTSSNGIGSINSQKLYMIYTKNEETEGKVYKSSLPYTFLDPRFNPITEEANASQDKSCIIIYDEAENGFKSYNAFPNIYFNDDINEFCWRINGLETPLPAQGPKGDKGDKGQCYMMNAIKKISNLEDSDSDMYELGFLNSNEGPITSEMNGCLAYIYCSDPKSGHISTMRVEYVESAQSYIATSILNDSTNIYTIFSGNSLKDVLTEVKPNSSFNYLFIPSKFDNGQLLEEAHVVTTKRSGDAILAPRRGFWWTGYDQSDWEALTDPNICIISPATINNSNSKRILQKVGNRSGVLYNNYKNTICPGAAYFGRVATPRIAFDNLEKDQSNNWHISPSEDDILTIDRYVGSDEDGACVHIANSSLHVDGNVTVENELVSKSIILKSDMSSEAKYDGRSMFMLDAQTGSMRLHDLYVTGPATIGELETLNYKVPSLILPDTYSLNILTDSTHLVYLTWNVRDTDRDIPTIAPGQGNKNFLQAGKPKYIINTTELPSISHGTGSTKIHLTFDMGNDWPPTQIEWNFGRTPETISFTNGKVKIYTDFKINTEDNADNVIIVQNGVSGISFVHYAGELNQMTSILLTPYDAASTPDYKAYKLTFENAGAFTYTDEITGIENKLLVQLSELRAEIATDYMPKGSINWGDIKDAPTIPALIMDNDNIIIKSGDNSFTLPTNINSRIQSQIESTLSGKDFVTKGTLTMMGGFNPGTNSGTNSNDTEPVVQLLNKQSEGYVITDFCNIIVKYLDGNAEVEREKYLQWPIKGNVIRGVYHPAESNGTLSMSVAVVAKSEISINGIDVNVAKITIDGRDPMFGLGCSYGDTKTVPWEVKLEGDKNFKTTVSGYVTLTYTT